METINSKQKISSSEKVSFIRFSLNLITCLEESGKTCTADRYRTTLNSFLKFRAGKETRWEEMNEIMICRYEEFMKIEGLCPNSTSFYMRNLRAIYNRAAEQGLAEDNKMFRHVYTGIEKTLKRAVPIGKIRKLKTMDLTAAPLLDYARDMFMFSFYTRGMSIIDMAYLKKKDLKGGILSYRRHKTRQRLIIKWEKPMQKIIDKYEIPDSIYLLPIIRRTDKDTRRQYLTAAHLINSRLKKIGEELELENPLTMYVARHTWASIAKSKNIPLSTISEAMGHDSEKTTRIYLASLDSKSVNRANSIIINSL